VDFWALHPTELWWLVEAKTVPARAKSNDLGELWADMKQMEGFPHG